MRLSNGGDDPCCPGLSMLAKHVPNCSSHVPLEILNAYRPTLQLRILLVSHTTFYAMCFWMILEISEHCNLKKMSEKDSNLHEVASSSSHGLIGVEPKRHWSTLRWCLNLSPYSSITQLGSQSRYRPCLTRVNSSVPTLASPLGINQTKTHLAIHLSCLEPPRRRS